MIPSITGKTNGESARLIPAANSSAEPSKDSPKSMIFSIANSLKIYFSNHTHRKKTSQQCESSHLAHMKTIWRDENKSTFHVWIHFFDGVLLFIQDLNYLPSLWLFVILCIYHTLPGSMFLWIPLLPTGQTVEDHKPRRQGLLDKEQKNNMKFTERFHSSSEGVV